ncbi:tRNA-splicing ligase RtcB [uncultured archaeon]|nr:tRNA-splicing ligase RtcB [uncultured archaeon]
MDFKKLRDCVWESKGETPVPLRVYANDLLFAGLNKDRTMKQLENVSHLPGIIDAAILMPDGHEGYGFPIGGVAAFDAETGIVSPGGIGFDINCGVRLLSTDLTYADIKPKLKDLTNELFKSVPCGVGSKSQIRLNASQLSEATKIGLKWCLENDYAVKNDLLHCEEGGTISGADPEKVSDMAKKRGGPQFGTLGSGNHFLEVQRVDEIYDPEIAKAFGINEVNQITVMVHCGSRGFGHQICDDYVKAMLPEFDKFNLPDKELSCASLEEKVAQDYVGAMNCAVNFAFNNRQVISHFIRQSFETVFKKSWNDDLNIQLVYDVCHNIGKVEEHNVQGKKRKLFIHRKGATRAFWKGHKDLPADYRKVGQPVIIPGSMNTCSYLLCGLPGSEETFGTVCHGAGRLMSRHEAARTFKAKELVKQMEDSGQFIRSATKEGLIEEAGGAYKNVSDVVESIERAGLAKIVCKLTPLGIVKG